MKYLLTVGEVASKARVSAAAVRRYADCGLIDCMYTSRGDRLFLESAIDEARKVKDNRVLRRLAPAAAQVQ